MLNSSSHRITFFRFVDFCGSIKKWCNSIERIKLEIRSSFKLLLLSKGCRGFLEFTCKCRCWVSASYYRFSDLFFCFSYGVTVAKNYKIGAILCSKLKLFLILKFMFLERTLLIFCRNDSAFSVWFSFSKLSAHISVGSKDLEVLDDAE